MIKDIQKNVQNLKVVEDVYSQYYHVTEELSRGGQGVVFKTKDPQILIKIALSKNGELANNIDNNERYLKLRLLPVSGNDHITLPLATLKNYEGYVMRMLRDMETFREHFDVLRLPEQQKSTAWIEQSGDLKEIFTNYYTTGGLKRRLEAFLKSGSALAKLHARGLVYCDYSPNNAFISKDTNFCNVWLIDADNLKEEKVALSNYLFTPGIAPPEIMLFAEEIAQGIPDSECQGCGNSFSSDTYTFAYCLFKELTFCDPFDGEAYNNDLDNCDDGREVIDAKKDSGEYSYIDDTKSDNRNNLFDNIVNYTLTNELRELFSQTFDSQRGKYWRWLRPTMFEFNCALSKALDKVLFCKNCGMHFVRNDLDINKCPWCDKKLGAILKLKSFYKDENNTKTPLWYFEKEIGDVLEVPLRLLHGYNADEIDDICLKIKKDNGKYILELDAGLDCILSFSWDGSNFEKCFSAYFQRDKFYLNLNDVATKRDIYVIGEVEG